MKNEDCTQLQVEWEQRENTKEHSISIGCNIQI